jgi:hypothetical protein
MFQFTHGRANAFDLVTGGRVFRDQVDGSFHVLPGPPPYQPDADGGVHLPSFRQAGLIEDSELVEQGTTLSAVRLTVAGAHLNDRWRGNDVESVVQHPPCFANILTAVPAELVTTLYEAPPVSSVEQSGDGYRVLVVLGGKGAGGARRVLLVEQEWNGAERVALRLNPMQAEALAAGLLAAALESGR